MSPSYPIAYPITRANAYAPANALLGRAGGPVTILDPLPAGSLVIRLGDSEDEFDYNAGSGANQAATIAIRSAGLNMNALVGGELIAALAVDPTLVDYRAWNDTSDSTGLLTNTGRYYAGGDRGQAGGVSGDIIGQVAKAFAYAAGAVPLIVWGGGTNYIGTSDSTYLTAKTNELAAIRAQFPRSPILALAIRAVAVSQGGANNRSAANIVSRNTQLQNLVAASPGVFYVDFYTSYADDVANPGYGSQIHYQSNPYQSAPAGDDLHTGGHGATVILGPTLLTAVRAHVQSGSNQILARKVASVLPAGWGTNTGSSVVSHTAVVGGGTVTGHVPTGMDVATGGNNQITSLVCSLEANADTGVQSLVVDGTVPAGYASSFTGSISGTTLTASSALTGVPPDSVYCYLYGTGMAAGTMITAKTTAAATVAAQTSGQNNVTFQSLPGTAPIVGGSISGTGLASGTRVASYDAGTGVVGLTINTSGTVTAGTSLTYDTGVYTVNKSQTVASTTISVLPTKETAIIRPAAINFASSALQSQWSRMWAEMEFDLFPGWLTVQLQSGERSNFANNQQNVTIGIYPDGRVDATRRYWPVTPHLQYVAGSTGASPSLIVNFNPNAFAGAGGTFRFKERRWDIQTETTPVRP